MRIDIMILPVKEKTAATLRIKVPKQNTKSTFGQETGQVNRCGGFANATLDIIYGDLFQKLKLSTRGLLND